MGLRILLNIFQYLFLQKTPKIKSTMICLTNNSLSQKISLAENQLHNFSSNLQFDA